MLILFLRHEEGHAVQLSSIWGLATAFGLPFLAAVAASRGFTLDRERGMMRLMFSTPFRARGWVLAKIIAAAFLALIYMIGMAIAVWVLVRWMMPGAQLPWTWIGFWTAGSALLVEAFLWSSIGTLVSLLLRSSASTFLLSLLLGLLAPPLVCMSMTSTLPESILQWPWFPLQFLVYDCASGIIHLRALVACIIATVTLIYISSVVFDALRVNGKEK